MSMESTLELLEDIKKCMIEGRPLDIAMAFRIEGCIAKLRALSAPEEPFAPPTPERQLEEAASVTSVSSNGEECEIFVGQNPPPQEHRGGLAGIIENASNVFKRD